MREYIVIVEVRRKKKNAGWKDYQPTVMWHFKKQ